MVLLTPDIAPVLFQVLTCVVDESTGGIKDTFVAFYTRTKISFPYIMLRHFIAIQVKEACFQYFLKNAYLLFKLNSFIL